MPIVLIVEFTSRLIEAIAAKQGVYKRVKVKNAKALAVVNIVVIPVGINTSKVDTTVSFAIKPVTNAVTKR